MFVFGTERFELSFSCSQGKCLTSRLRSGKLEPALGIEPRTDGLQNRCSSH